MRFAFKSQRGQFIYLDRPNLTSIRGPEAAILSSTWLLGSTRLSNNITVKYLAHVTCHHDRKCFVRFIESAGFCDFTFVGGLFLQPPVVSFMKSAYYCCHLFMHFHFTHFPRPKKPDNPGKAPEDMKANRTHQAANIKGVNTVNFRVNVDFYCLSFWLLRLNKVWLKSNFCFVYCDQIMQQKK